MEEWATLAIFITGYDIWRWRHGKDTLSQAWGSMLKDPKTRPLCYLAWGVLTAHLFVGRPRWWRMPQRRVECQPRRQLSDA